MPHNIRGFYKGIKMLAFGSLSARLVGLALIPILTRLYTPEDYGALSVFSSLILIISPLLTLRYVTAIPLPKSDMAAVVVVLISVFSILLFSLLLLFVFLGLHDYIFVLLNVYDYVQFWFLIPLACFLVSFYEVLNMWAVRKRNYKALMNVSFFQAIAGEGVKVSAGLLGLTKIGLIIGFAVSQSAGIFYLLQALSPTFLKGLKFVSLKRLLIIVKYYSGYPFYRMPSQLLLLLASQSPLLFFSFKYGVEATGQFSLSLMAIVLPMNLIGQAISKAYYAEIASIGREGIQEVMTLTIDLQKKLLILGAPIAALLYFLAEPLFPLLFGPAWEVAGVYVSILSMYLLTQFTSAPLMQVFNLFNMQGKYLLINIVRIFSLVGVYFCVLIFDVSEMWFVKIYSVSMFLFYLLITIYVLVFLKRKEKGID